MPQTAPSGAVLILDGVARLILIAFAALLPLFILPVDWSSVPQSKILLVAVVALVVAVLWAFARLLEGVIALPRSALMYAVLLLPLAYAVSATATGFGGAALVGQGIEQDTLAAVVTWYAVFVLTMLLFAGHPAGIRSIVRSLAVGLTALFAFQALYMFLPTWFSLGILQGATANVLGSWHDLGILASVGLFLSIVLFRSGVFAGSWRTLSVALGVLSCFFLVVVHFTDIFWGAAALMACAFAATMRALMQADGDSFTEALKRCALFPVLGILFGLAAAFGTTLWEKLPAPILISEVEVRPSWQGTFDVGRQSLGAPQTLLFGTGPNSFVREWGEHKPAGVNTTPFWNADFNFGVGIIPTSVFTAGAVGLIAWLGIVLVLLSYAWRFLRDARHLATGRVLFGALLGTGIYLLAFHMIYTPGAALTGLMFLVLGLLAVVAAGERPARTISTANMTNAVVFALLVLLIVPAGFAAGTTAREVVSNLYVNRAASAYRASMDVAEAGRMIETALAISPRNDRAHRAASELGLAGLSQLLAEGNPDTAEARTRLQQSLQTTIQHGLTAVEIDDANYQNWLILAQVYGSLAGVNVDGAYEQAKTTYERAYQANPTNPIPKLRLAQLSAARGDREATRAYLQEALALKQDFAAAYFLLSQVEAGNNNDAAIQNAATAVQLVPDDPLGWFNLGSILYSAGANSDAAAAFEQAIMRANDYSNAYFYLGSTYHRLQRPEDAVLAFRRVLELNPSEVWITQVISNIQRGAEPFEGVSQVQ